MNREHHHWTLIIRPMTKYASEGVGRLGALSIYQCTAILPPLINLPLENFCPPPTVLLGHIEDKIEIYYIQIKSILFRFDWGEKQD
jgi:hypothetical protein